MKTFFTLYFLDLQNNKAAGGEIPLNILKKSNYTFDELTKCVNYTLKNGNFLTP